ncbi:E3 ubiquitin-protein ligase ARK2C-like [Pseudophryne corroboree]|uniref:E3 ubiquitin-protein ligase ARK2C-like n=1 Tax=Pseudophryne corroboree TaxID=495146 RepID=UPI003081807C
MSRRTELRRLLEDQRRWSRHGDHDDSTQTVFEERLRSERRRGERRSRQDTQEHLQRPQREHRHRSRSPLPAPEIAPTDGPSPDPLPGPSHLQPTSQQPAENRQNLSDMVHEIVMQMMTAAEEADNEQNIPPILEEIIEQNRPAVVEEMHRQNVQALQLKIRFFQSTIIAGDEATQSCAICLMQYQDGERVSTLPCSHKYHPSCILQWFATHSSCPLCRGECIPGQIECWIS